MRLAYAAACILAIGSYSCAHVARHQPTKLQPAEYVFQADTDEIKGSDVPQDLRARFKVDASWPCVAILYKIRLSTQSDISDIVTRTYIDAACDGALDVFIRHSQKSGASISSVIYDNNKGKTDPRYRGSFDLMVFTSEDLFREAGLPFPDEIIQSNSPRAVELQKDFNVVRGSR